MDSKTARQKQQAEMWRDAKGLGGFQNPTGFGKTYQTINFICAPMLDKNPHIHFLVVVHSVALRKQWGEEIAKFLPTKTESFTVETVQGILARGIKLQCTCLIIDELDEFFGKERRKVWDDRLIDFKFLCWLSATPQDRYKRHMAFMEKYPCLDVVTVQEALANGWITPYREFNLGTDLTPEEREGYDSISLQLHNLMARFNFDFDKVQKCLAPKSEDSEGKEWTGFQWCCGIAAHKGWKPAYEDYAKNGFPFGFTDYDKAAVIDILKEWTPGLVMKYAKDVMQFTRERKDIIYNSANKRKAAIEIVKMFPDRKTILFSQSVAFAIRVAEELTADGIPCLAYHSKIESQPLRMNRLGQPDLFGNGDFIRYKTGAKKGEPKLFGAKVIKELIIEAFSKGVCTHMATASALDKGLNIPDIELGINGSTSSNSSQYVQRRGRTVRINADGNPSFVYIINLYAKDTRDKEFLRSAQKEQTYVYWIDSPARITDGIVETQDGFSLDDL